MLLRRSISKNNLRYPVYIDNDLQFFNALGAPGWPVIYLVDKDGKVRFSYLGETHAHFAQARDIENKIRLLGEE